MLTRSRQAALELGRAVAVPTPPAAVAGPPARTPRIASSGGAEEGERLGAPLRAVGHRDARFALRVLSPLGATDPEGDLTTVRKVHAEVLAVVEPWRLGRNVNFLLGEQQGRADAAEVARSTHGAAARARLADLKAAHDPENVFRFHPSEV
ncbi:BBE domain-containing protein [Streptomyces noursei]|uniref:BBE domain-containing protein n=1 Tax=Streptomyces noursei TaxID=1971 RepID=UPI001964BCED|nr:BBE domain-containing protein [Streptomyces noursei]QRX93797.1 hypothetical protein JNO44_25750 [Streptomyces noursei]